ncbi:MAG: rRNA maturation RNase YbeY [Clostridia bacterium]|nr:rRNA maturation RNase YbeY [Clostridia bacterium]MBQ4250220.1 rRNA maturation RNase YbeY [Clostridia bacterium]
MNTAEFINRQRKVKVTAELKEKLIECIRTALSGEGIEDGAHVDVTFVSDKRIREINREYRGKDAATDVLSFPMVEFSEGKPMCDLEDERDEDGVLFLGDIIISLERAAAQAEEYGHSFMREAGFLCTHSVLHLVGYDHEEDEPSRQTMRKKEEAVLKKVGLAR